jgi:Ca2+-binding RTX toxin-like protein
VLGGAGSDVLRGEAGDDTFVVQGHDQGADRIRGGDGYDEIVGGVGDDTITLAAFALGYSIERIDGGSGFNILRGTADDNFLNFSATELFNISRIEGAAGIDKIRGSQAGDVILGGAGNDVLRGQAGNDTLSGGAADDILVGGAGNDTYVFAVGDGRDKIHNNDVDTSAYDLLRLEIDSYDAIWLSRRGNRLLVDMVGTEDQIQVMNWFGAAEDQLDAIHTNDHVLLRGQVDQLVAAMATFDAPTGVGAVVPEETRVALEAVLAASWQSAA